jgi:dihydroorotate dehydrogenase electron transfer subunit
MMFCSPRSIWHGSGMIETNHRIAERTFRLAITVQEELPAIRSGQFVMLRLPNRSDPLLGRPLAIYQVKDSRLEVVYLVVGKMTARLAELKSGNTLELWMPLGNGFAEYESSKVDHTIMVAGGIGQTPFLMLAEKLVGRRTLLYGARNSHRIACLDDFEKRGVEIQIATDDGSQGYHGTVTDLIQTVHKPDETTQILCCGPQPMLHAAFQIARQLELPCAVSLETPMSCGLGICFGCAVKYRTETNDWDYRRTCVDGPIFDAYKLLWNE